MIIADTPNFILYSIFFLVECWLSSQASPKWTLSSLRSEVPFKNFAFGDTEKLDRGWETLFNLNSVITPKTHVHPQLYTVCPDYCGGTHILSFHFCVCECLSSFWFSEFPVNGFYLWIHFPGDAQGRQQEEKQAAPTMVTTSPFVVKQPTCQHSIISLL